MFNNIIYFIIVLIVFNVSDERVKPEYPLGYTLAMLFTGWVIFGAYCRWAFNRLTHRFKRDGEEEAELIREYHGLIFRFSIIAILLFALDIFVFHLKYWLPLIPGFKPFSVLQGVLGVMVFLFYLMTIWYHSHPVYQIAFNADIKRRSFIVSNVKLNMPVLFPWVILSLVYDLIALIPWADPEGPLSEPKGQMVFFAFFMIILMIFMPRLIQYWWGCKPLAPSLKVEALEEFFQEKGFRYRQLLRWPIFEGRMMTAGMMGIVPRYRYILVTESLMEILSIEELKAVMAHEMGHAKYRHLLLYTLFFFGFMVISLGLFDLFRYFLLTQTFFLRLLEGRESEASTLFYVFLSLPILFTMVIYFRYVMGFFMRHFERQADLYSAVVMGSAHQIISSLEKIAVMSGKIRDLPSWHHFSIKERVVYLWRATNSPGLVRKHNQFMAISFGVYLVLMGALGYMVNFSSYRENLTYRLIGKALEEQAKQEPHNLLLYKNLAMLYHKLGDFKEAIRTYEKILSLDPYQTEALNNLAWILVTAPDETMRDKEKALFLAKSAVALERSPMFLDTLAEAQYASGFVDEAVETIKEALSMASEGRSYYETQLRRFEGKTQVKKLR